MDDDHQRAEAEKELRVKLKYAGYGYEQMYDEMRGCGQDIDLYADSTSFKIEVVDRDGSVIANAVMPRFGHRGLDRAARQIRAQLQVDGAIEAWEGE